MGPAETKDRGRRRVRKGLLKALPFFRNINEEQVLVREQKNRQIEMVDQRPRPKIVS